MAGKECEEQRSTLSSSSNNNNNKFDIALDVADYQIYSPQKKETSECSYITIDGLNNENWTHSNSNTLLKDNPASSKASTSVLSTHHCQITEETERQPKKRMELARIHQGSNRMPVSSESVRGYQGFDRLAASVTDFERRCQESCRTVMLPLDCETKYQDCNKTEARVLDVEEESQDSYSIEMPLQGSEGMYRSCNRRGSSSDTEMDYSDCDTSAATARCRKPLDVSPWRPVDGSSSKLASQTWWSQSKDAVKIIITLAGVEDYTCHFLTSRLIFT